MTRKRRSFTPEFKQEAACLVLDQGYTVTQACRSLNVGENALRRWIKQLSEERVGVTPKSKALTPEQQRIQELDAFKWTTTSNLHLWDDKRDAIAQDLPPNLERLAIEPKHWLSLSRHLESRFKGLVGTGYAVKKACQQLGYQRNSGVSQGRTLLG